MPARLFLLVLAACTTGGGIGALDPEETTPPDTPVETDDTGGATSELCECPPGFSPTPAADWCVRVTSIAATYNGVTLDVCKSTTDSVYGKFGARYPAGTNVQSDYWGDDDGVADGRLNAAGVWACDAVTGVAGIDPIGEWIGFGACVDITQPGDFLVGIAGDNQVRLKVDSDLVFEDTSGGTSAFNYWYLTAIDLASGTHQVELYGQNDGSIAAFAAEIAGPFAAGSLVSDADMIAADYEGSLVFTTAGYVGELFELGQSSGWSCPDGYAVDLCGEKPMCTKIEYEECIRP